MLPQKMGVVPASVFEGDCGYPLLDGHENFSPPQDSAVLNARTKASKRHTRTLIDVISLEAGFSFNAGEAKGQTQSLACGVRTVGFLTSEAEDTKLCEIVFLKY